MANRLEPATRHHDEKLQQILKTSAKIFAEKDLTHLQKRHFPRDPQEPGRPLLYFAPKKSCSI
jgi:hypothetical protein